MYVYKVLLAGTRWENSPGSSGFTPASYIYIYLLYKSNIRLGEFLWSIKTFLQANETCLITPDFSQHTYLNFIDLTANKIYEMSHSVK